MSIMASMLKGQNINLRTMRRRDLEQYLELASDIEARGHYFPLNLHTETSLQARYDKDGFWSDESGLLLVVEKASDQILGSLQYFKGVHYYNGLEIGYIVFDPAQRGKGIMREALALFVKYLFDWLPIHRLQLQVERGNVASRRLAESCGFQFEGTARGAILSRGIPTDIDVLSLLRSDLPD